MLTKKRRLRTRLPRPAAAFLGFLCAFSGALAREIHFSPEERLDAIDAALIDGAKRSIDLASSTSHRARATDRRAVVAAPGHSPSALRATFLS